MRRSPFSTGPALLIFSAMEVLQGFAIYAIKEGLPRAHYGQMASFFPLLAASLVFGGAVLLLTFRYPLTPSVNRALVLIPAIPAGILAWGFAQVGLWPAALNQAFLALSIGLIPWLTARRDGWDYATFVLAAAQFIAPLAWLLPTSMDRPLWLLPLVLLAGWAGALVLIMPRVRPGWKVLPWFVRRAVRALLPVIMIVWSVQQGIYTEALIWVIWLITSVLGDLVTPPSRMCDEAESSEEQTLAAQDLVLESWNWMLIVLVVALAAVPGIKAPTPTRILLFAAGVSVYNTSVYLFLTSRRFRRQRIVAHAIFMVLALGLLVTGNGSMGPGTLTLLAVAAPLVGWVMGARIGYRMLGLAVVLVVLAELEPWISGLRSLNIALGSLTVELLVTLLAGLVGLSMVRAQQRLLRDLQQSQAETDRANLQLADKYAEMQRAHESLQTAHEQLLAQDQRMHEVNEALLKSEARMASFLAIAPNATVAVNSEQKIILFNRMAVEVFGYTEEEALGQPLELLLPKQFAGGHHRMVSQFSHDPIGSRAMSERPELSGRRKDGSTFPVQIAISRVTVGTETVFMAIIQDVSVQRATERRLKESEERFRSAFENAPIGVGLLSEKGVWLQVNRALSEMIGYSDQEMLGRTIDEFTHVDDWDIDHGAFSQLLMGQARSVQVEKRFRHKAGHNVWVQQSYSTMRDQTGAVNFIVQLQDITDRRVYETKLVHMANYDSLTELVNRRRFREELENQVALSRRFGLNGSLLFMDVDLFKYVNDTLGHQRGDEVLRRVAILLRETLRETDVIGRLGGDEFAIILPCTSTEETLNLVERILENMRHTHSLAGGASISLTASIGVTFFPQHGTSADELLANADMAMYEAKENGRNGWSVFEPNSVWKREMEQKLEWERRIREALQNDRLVLYYQPILDIRENQVTHHELLIRMLDEDGTLIYPAAFLGVAERFGLIQAIDRWVVRESIRLMGERARAGQPTTYEVNLSGKTLSDPDLMPMIAKELAEAGVNPANLVFEITETAAIGDIDQARRFIDDMKALGCRFALDDVGAGFSSLYFLKHLAVDYVKIDGSFIRNLPHDVADQHLVRALVTVSRELGKKTIAEFVDSEETLGLLREYGVDYAQGYLIGKPEPKPRI